MNRSDPAGEDGITLFLAMVAAFWVIHFVVLPGVIAHNPNDAFYLGGWEVAGRPCQPHNQAVSFGAPLPSGADILHFPHFVARTKGVVATINDGATATFERNEAGDITLVRWKMKKIVHPPADDRDAFPVGTVFHKC